jgi:hypothetical protein
MCACVLSNDADAEIKIYDINGRRIKNEYRVLVEWYRQDKSDLLGEKPVICQFLPQISYWLAWDPAQVSAVRSRPLGKSYL